jgi:hypothetical protein
MGGRDVGEMGGAWSRGEILKRSSLSVVCLSSSKGVSLYRGNGEALVENGANILGH